MVAGGYFTDARRTKIRQKTGVGFIEDYFLRSEISDYRRLRTLVNLIIGVPFCACLYYLGWKNLNFADFHFAYGVIFKWFMIISTALAFALSPMFRCAMLCVLLGAMGKNGQGKTCCLTGHRSDLATRWSVAPLSLLILENLQDGSITNIVTNYQRTAEILLCHLELQAKIASNRVSMLTGPVEGVLERQIDLGLQMLKDLISTIRSILVPFLAEIKATRTKEDKKLDERDEQISNLARRKALDSMMMNKKKSEENNEDDDNKESAGKPKEDDAKPTWAEFKTKDKCYEALPFYLEYFICPKLNTEESCNKALQVSNFFDNDSSKRRKRRIFEELHGRALHSTKAFVDDGQSFKGNIQCQSH
uniref:KAP NTPase domain-containing protein n=1 Tax=Angiostrongylus cantonensis TaxID=6313 RepID=A0A158P691_ANGCA